jgi:hypothetical protein
MELSIKTEQRTIKKGKKELVVDVYIPTINDVPVLGEHGFIIKDTNSFGNPVDNYEIVKLFLDREVKSYLLAKEIFDKYNNQIK